MPEPGDLAGPTAAPTTDPPRSFEQALQELETRVRKLDSGELPLEDALTVFEEGVGLVRECQELLDTAERRIVELTDGPEGVRESGVHESERAGT